MVLKKPCPGKQLPATPAPLRRRPRTSRLPWKLNVLFSKSKRLWRSWRINVGWSRINKKLLKSSRNARKCYSIQNLAAGLIKTRAKVKTRKFKINKKGRTLIFLIKIQRILIFLIKIQSYNARQLPPKIPTADNFYNLKLIMDTNASESSNTSTRVLLEKFTWLRI
jgi:hypothetical protein